MSDSIPAELHFIGPFREDTILKRLLGEESGFRRTDTEDPFDAEIPLESRSEKKGGVKLVIAGLIIGSAQLAAAIAQLVQSASQEQAVLPPSPPAVVVVINDVSLTFTAEDNVDQIMQRIDDACK